MVEVFPAVIAAALIPATAAAALLIGAGAASARDGRIEIAWPSRRSASVLLAEPSVRSSAAIGVAVFLQSADAAERLIAAVATALRAAERNRRNRVEMTATTSALRAA